MESMLRTPPSGVETRDEERLRAVNDLIDRRLIGAVYQPIVDRRTGEIFAYEALARSLTSDFENPMELYDWANKAGRVGELGRFHRGLAIRGCPDWPLFLNIYPKEFDFGLLVRPDDPIFRHRRPVYLELTESAPLSHFEQCHSVLGEVRKKGILLAIDDLGAGYSNLKYIADLAPDIVKLDRELVASAEPEGRQEKLLSALVSLCHAMGSKVVAEGIATEQEMAVASRAGVDYLQGYYLARPDAPPPPLRGRRR